MHPHLISLAPGSGIGICVTTAVLRAAVTRACIGDSLVDSASGCQLRIGESRDHAILLSSRCIYHMTFRNLNVIPALDFCLECNTTLSRGLLESMQRGGKVC